MKPFKKILVPTDFSVHAEEATRIAVDLSRRYEASIMLVYVYEPVSYALPEGYILYTPPQLDRMFAEFDTRLAGAKSAVESAGVGRVETRLLQGFAAGEICELASNGAFDLIVMGTHGRAGFKRLLLGSVAERVVRMAPCPVLTVRLPE
jgi:nucleotide-binding universal stress UspA family protein